jgi:ABC-2 type transport system ATP-binding protein
MSELVVAARGLVKRFGSVVALDQLDLEVRQGEVLGFLGPNGAGKTTAIRALLGQIRLDDGHATVHGLDVWDDAVQIHDRVAYVPGEVNLWGNLTGGQCIDALLAFHGAHDRSRRDELIERFELDPTKRARTYSKGNRQKVALIAALAMDADLLVLDEPTAGLDPLMEAQFRSYVREATGEGRTVLLSSHILGEVEALCDRVTIIRRGKDVITGSLDDLRRHTATTVQASTSSPVPGLDGLPGVSGLTEHPLPGGGVRTTARAGAEALPTLVRTLLDAGGTSLHVEPPSLDELFMEHYREQA